MTLLVPFVVVASGCAMHEQNSTRQALDAGTIPDAAEGRDAGRDGRVREGRPDASTLDGGVGSCQLFSSDAANLDPPDASGNPRLLARGSLSDVARVNDQSSILVRPCGNGIMFVLADRFRYRAWEEATGLIRIEYVGELSSTPGGCNSAGWRDDERNWDGERYRSAGYHDVPDGGVQFRSCPLSDCFEFVDAPFLMPEVPLSREGVRDGRSEAACQSGECVFSWWSRRDWDGETSGFYGEARLAHDGVTQWVRPIHDAWMLSRRANERVEYVLVGGTVVRLEESCDQEGQQHSLAFIVVDDLGEPTGVRLEMPWVVAAAACQTLLETNVDFPPPRESLVMFMESCCTAHFPASYCDPSLRDDTLASILTWDAVGAPNVITVLDLERDGAFPRYRPARMRGPNRLLADFVEATPYPNQLAMRRRGPDLTYIDREWIRLEGLHSNGDEATEAILPGVRYGWDGTSWWMVALVYTASEEYKIIVKRFVVEP
ncbi:MAG: hypothetical protein AB2A00_18205 [Myxococcota bacterium]